MAKRVFEVNFQKKVKGSSSRGCGGVALLLDLAGLLCFVAAGVVSSDKVYHIVETPGAPDLLAEEGPTDKYYQRLRADLSERYPAASEHLLDHLEALEAFLDKSIMAGVTFGIDKAKVGVIEGELLGHCVGRFGARCSQEKTKAVQDFPALREKLTVLGLTNLISSAELLTSGVCALRKAPGRVHEGSSSLPGEWSRRRRHLRVQCRSSDQAHDTKSNRAGRVG